MFTLLAACGGPNANVPDNTNGTFVRDTARIVSIDPALGQVVLDLHGRQVRAYWQTELAIPQQGSVFQNDPTGLRAPVGQYREPIKRVQAFDAAEGDRISFLGMWSGNQIFLRSVSVVK